MSETRLCRECGKPRDAEVHWPPEYVGLGGHDFVPPDKCWGALRLTDDCYGFTGGRRYDCTVCGSYFVTGRDQRPTNCPFPLVVASELAHATD